MPDLENAVGWGVHDAVHSQWLATLPGRLHDVGGGHIEHLADDVELRQPDPIHQKRFNSDTLHSGSMQMGLHMPAAAPLNPFSEPGSRKAESRHRD